jgi:glycosyltransferase involved in cell wall biosynthesis
MKISILMPAYNEGKFISDAIASVFACEYPSDVEVELIVVDDFSLDDTFLISQTLAAQNNWPVHLIKNNIKGKNNAFNAAFVVSSGDYICLMGGDDLIVPEVLVRRVQALFSGGGPGPLPLVSYCKLMTFSSSREHDAIEIPKIAHLGSSSGGGIMMARSLATSIFPLPAHLPNEDTWIGSHLKYMDVEGVHVPLVGLHYRIHTGNSYKRDVSHEQHKTQLWLRAKGLLEFYVQYSNRLSTKNEKRLLLDIVVEVGKYVGWGWSWLLLEGVGFKIRARAISHSNRLGYLLRQTFHKYLIGR